MEKRRKKGLLSRAVIVVFSVIGVVIFLRVVQAGTLSPTSSPTGTMNTIGDVYDSLVGTSYDSSGVASSSTGNAIKITKCIITQMHGGSC